MKKYMKYIILAICIIVAIVCLVVFNKNNTESVNAQSEDSNTQTENADEQLESENKIIEENVVDNIEDTPENTVEEKQSSSNEISEKQLNVLPTSTVYEQEDDVGSTNRKQKAIDLVKEKWGEDDTVSFRCDSVTNDGEYIIAVISTDSAKVKNYFKVNLEKEEVEVDY